MATMSAYLLMDKLDQEKHIQWYENAQNPATKNIALTGIII